MSDVAHIGDAIVTANGRVRHRAPSLARLAATWRVARVAAMTRNEGLRHAAVLRLRAAADALLSLASELEAGRVTGRTFASVVASTCAACGATIAAGEVIGWRPRTAVCSRCRGEASPARSQHAPAGAPAAKNESAVAPAPGAKNAKTTDGEA